MSLQINDVAPDFDATDFEGVRPHLLDLVQGTTRLFADGVLWIARLGEPSHRQSFKRARRQSTQGGCNDQFSAS